MIAPAAATVTALVVLWIGLRGVAREVALLRLALRRSAATAVAGDELLREVAAVTGRLEATRASSRRLRAGFRRARPARLGAP